jgi:2-polyprenyl-3-methyl-5-hydroxy-6-metoxy-1,4-benzoquinol methylase
MSKEEWQKVHQPYELKFHKGNNFRWNDTNFMKLWDILFGEFMEFSKDQFKEDEIILDIGCGSRPCLDWFESGERYHLDPLLNSYVTIPQVKRHWESKDPANLLSQPAEELKDDLVDKCDFIVCVNVLDHTYDWRAILSNMVKYGKSGSYVCFTTDLNSHGIGHPGIDNHDEFYKFIEDHYEIIKSIPNYYKREISYNLRKK